ncbi:MAG: hypothetical protein EAZ42_11980 [Verrucomicrobia bacterium]|nr:MAG: hypothetical protein EAZ42_11980 [Verrucomicrobiota bacterium]
MGHLARKKWGWITFPRAVQIVDNYHAIEHLESLIEALLGKTDPSRFARRRRHWRKMLLADGVERIIVQARKEAEGTTREEAVEAQLGNFVHNIERMQYGTFRKKGWFAWHALAPAAGKFDCFVAVVAIGAWLAMERFKIAVIPTLGVCAALGILVKIIGWA